MTCTEKTLTADARALQEYDSFCSAGWKKIIAPAKVNLFLGISSKRPDGYHDVYTILHALTLHDTVFMRKKTPDDASYGTNIPEVQLIQTGGFDLPLLSSVDNLATKAVLLLQKNLQNGLQSNLQNHSQNNRANRPQANSAMGDVIIRIEKNIPFQAGLGGASTDAAAALIGAALLEDLALNDPLIEATARALGADVPFFLRGGCAYYEGVGDAFCRALEPESCPVALIKPAQGVSTTLAYSAFDNSPVKIDEDLLCAAQNARIARKVPLFNNLAPAAETLLPCLEEIRKWVQRQQGVTNALLCGSGATTFALCDSIDTALKVVTDARQVGFWARTTSLSSIGVQPLNSL